MANIHELHQHLNTETANAGDVDDANNIATQQLTTGLAFALPVDNNVSNAYEAWQQHQPKVLDVLNALNEKFVIDFAAIRENVKELYIQRWNTAYRPEHQPDIVTNMVNNVSEQPIPAEQISTEGLSMLQQANVTKVIEMGRRALGVK